MRVRVRAQVKLNRGLDHINLDDILVDLKLSPDVLEVPVPKYFIEDRAKELDDRDKWVGCGRAPCPCAQGARMHACAHVGACGQRERRWHLSERAGRPCLHAKCAGRPARSSVIQCSAAACTACAA